MKTLLLSNDQYVQRYALGILATIPVEDSFVILKKYLTRDSPLFNKIIAINAFVNNQQQLIKFLDDPELPISLRSMQVITDNHVESAAASLMRLVRTSNFKEIRIAAIKSLGLLHAVQSVDLLIDAYQDDSVDIKSCVLSALGNIGGVLAINKLIASTADADPRIRAIAIENIIKLNDHHAIFTLQNSLKSEPSSYCRYLILHALTSDKI
jgi:HEAT repeat protein